MSAQPDEKPFAVAMRGIRKRFGRIVADDGVDFDLYAGEIHALVGENGAGKTTLMNILFGLHRADEGDIFVRGKRVDIDSPHEALALGLGMVHQHFMLIPKFTVAENVVLGTQLRAMPLRRSEINRAVAEASRSFDLPIDPGQRVEELSVDERQRVEILRLLYRGANILILDEPTSVLGPAQIESLFNTLTDLKERGESIVIVTHKLSEVMYLADRVTVLRGGRNVLVANRGSYDEDHLARAMTGMSLRKLPSPSTRKGEGTASALEVRDLSVRGHLGHNAVDGVSLLLRPGEIVGVAGVAGNGQHELLYAIAGVLEVEKGAVYIGTRDVTRTPPRIRRRAGLGIIPDNRREWGVALDMTVAENLAMPRVATGRAMERGRWLDISSHHRYFRRLLEEYDVRPPDPELRLGTLSGGNQQRVMLARELDVRPIALAVANPTQGLDVSATDFVRRRLLEAANHGSSVLLASNDLDELMQLSDRIIVMFRGRIAYEANRSEALIDHVAAAMAGAPLHPRRQSATRPRGISNDLLGT